jgi:hypothetical protein
MVLWLAVVTWPSWSAAWDYLSAFTLAIAAPWMTLSLARSSLIRRRHYEDWARLDIA